MDDDDEFFSDDAIADLPSSTLLELEQNAWAATQRQKEAAAQQHAQVCQPPQAQVQILQRGLQSHWPEEQGGVNANATRPPLLQRQSTSTSRGSSHPISRPTTSFCDAELQNLDAGVLDDGAGPAPIERQDVIIIDQPDREQRPVGEQDAALRAHAYGGGQQWPPAAAWQDAERNELHGEGMYTTAEYGADNATHETGELLREAERLREQVEQLTREREALLQELRTSKSLSESRAGEIAIIRANQAKQQKAFDAQLSALRTAMAEQARKHAAEVEASEMESKRLTTENAFLRQDLREEAFRLQQQQLQQKKKESSRGDNGHQPMTPRKPRTLPFRDGFDDDEIMASPSRSTGRRSNRGTPSGGAGKRKRKVVDDSPPGAVLQLSPSFADSDINNDDDGAPPLGEPGAEADAMEPEEPRAKPYIEDRNVRFMRSILNHKTYPNKLRDLEVFANMSFPSQPDRTFSSFILEATSTTSSATISPTPAASQDGFPTYAISYAKAIISLWSRALNEKFYKPINIFMSIIKYILYLDMRSLAPPLIPDLVPVLRESAYVNGFRRFRHSPNWHLNRGQVKQTPARELSPDVNGTDALEILYNIASSGCLHDEKKEAFVAFWTAIRYDFILMMLNAYQPVRDIILTLNLLSCSIATSGMAGNNSSSNSNNTVAGLNKKYTFGPIHGTEADQVANENYILERAANLLSETPSVDEGLPPCGSREITTLRLEVMYFLTEVAFSSPLLSPQGNRTTGAQLLLSNPTVLPRIFRSMHDELDALYSAHAEDQRALHAELINGLTRLAYGVLHSSPTSLSRPSSSSSPGAEGRESGGAGQVAKLNLHAVPGAVQKHLVVLTRLAFSERGVIPADNNNNTNNNSNNKKANGAGQDDHEEANTGAGTNVLLEAGIDLETVEMAHEMLEEAVNPQEAEALVEAFRPGFVGGMGMSVEEDGSLQER
ncbi:hypothetical protein VTO42DRAFT_357 [Malbranchea cinnamomea]